MAEALKKAQQFQNLYEVVFKLFNSIPNRITYIVIKPRGNLVNSKYLIVFI